MKFDWMNRNEICNIDIRDSIIFQYYYSCEARDLYLTCKNEVSNKRFHFLFRNVLFSTLYGNQMNTADSIEKIMVEEPSKCLQQLLMADQSQNAKSPWFEWDIPFLTLEIQMKSGAKLIIVCDDIYFKESEWISGCVWHAADMQNGLEYDFDTVSQIKDFYIHDSDFSSFCYDDSLKTISFSCKNQYLKKEFSFRFLDVCGYSMQSCNYLGKDTRIWEMYAHKYIINTLVAGSLGNSGLNGIIKNGTGEEKVLEQREPYFTVVFELASGDILMISCLLMKVNERLN